MAGNSLGSAGVQLYADTAQYQQDMSKAAAVAEREMRRIQRESSMAAAIVTELGKRTQLASVETQQGMVRQATATRMASEQSREHARTVAESRRQMQLLNYQMTDIVSGLATGQSPFYVLMQQGGQLRDQAGSVRGALGLLGRGVVGLLNPYTLLAAATAGVAYEMYQGAKETEAFQRQVALTGNYAAITEAKLTAMAEARRASLGRNAEDNRASISALAGTGLFGAAALEEATRAMTAYQRLSGETADEAVKHFSNMGNSAARWAAEQSRSLHFLTAARYAEIKALEDHGKHEQAMLLALRTMAGELETRTAPQVWGLAKAWKSVTDWASSAKRAVMDWGKPETMDNALQAAEARLKDLESSATTSRLVNLDAKWGRNGAPEGSSTRKAIDKWRADVEAARIQVRELRNLQAREQTAADAEAKRMAVEQDKIDKLTSTPSAKKQEPTDFLGAMEDGFKKRIDDWAQRNQEALDKVEEEDRKTQAAMDALIAAAQQRQGERDQARADKASFGFGVQTAARTWWDDFNDQAKRGQEQFGKTMKGMEDAVINWAKTGKLSASDFFGSMAEEFLRRMVQMAQAKAFFGTDGSLFGAGSWLSGVGSLATTLFGFANGTPNIQQDGPYYLHEGERVMTKQENLAFGNGSASGAGRAMHFDFSGQTIYVGQGVSMAQVASAVRAGNQATEQRMRRLSREGVFA